MSTIRNSEQIQASLELAFTRTKGKALIEPIEAVLHAAELTAPELSGQSQTKSANLLTHSILLMETNKA